MTSSVVLLAATWAESTPLAMMFVALVGVLALMFRFNNKGIETRLTLLEDQQKEITQAMKSMRDDFISEMKSMRDDFTSEMKSMREGFGSEIKALRDEFASEIKEVRKEIKEITHVLHIISERLVRIETLLGIPVGVGDVKSEQGRTPEPV